MTAEIEIIDKAEVKEKQKKDITTYHQMLEGIVRELNENKIYASWDNESSGHDSHLFHQQERKEFAKISPISLEEDDTLKSININVYCEDAFCSIERAVKMYSYVYNHLKKITIVKDLKRKADVCTTDAQVQGV